MAEASALVINVGEMLEVATDGYLVATDHRVLPCAPGTTRQSIGIFWSPRLDATLDPLPLRPELAAQAPGVSQHEHNALLPRFGDNALKGWLRSHPEVGAAVVSRVPALKVAINGVPGLPPDPVSWVPWRSIRPLFRSGVAWPSIVIR